MTEHTLHFELFAFVAVVLTGFTACAEFGSYAFVHPVIRRLPREHHIAVEQGLVRTFGRIMPVLMPLSLVALIAWASLTGWSGVQTVAVVSWAVGLITTIAVNVGINARTARWDTAATDSGSSSGADGWDAMRRRWELFQGVRSWAFLTAWVLVCAAASVR